MLFDKYLIKFILFFFLKLNYTHSQKFVNVGSDIEFLAKDLSLLNSNESNAGFTIRPIFHDTNDTSFKRYFYFEKNLSSNLFKNCNKLNLIYPSPILLINTISPWGRNNYSIQSIRGRQLQSFFGFNYFTKYLDFNFQPEFLSILNFRDYNYQKLFLYSGNTNLSIKPIKNLAFIIGSMYQWWGPGIFNSLILSNNSPSIPQISIRSLKPLDFHFVDVEFNLLGGLLLNSRDDPMENFYYRRFYTVLPDKIHHKRYISGLNLSFKPKFMKEFTFGLNRVFQYNLPEIKLQGDLLQRYLPVFGNLFKDKTGGDNGFVEDRRNRDQMLSVYVSCSLHESGLEAYLEHGWTDHLYNIRDFIMNPEHSSGSIFGIRKVFISKSSELNTIEFEVSRLAPTNSIIARSEPGNWYVHSLIQEGYQHFGQIVGGGLGPGDNSITFRYSKRSRDSKRSIYIEKYRHNPQYSPIRWNDLCIGFNFQREILNNSFSADLNFIIRNNYNFKENTNYNFQPSLKYIHKF